MTFQERLYQLRRERGLSQENLADLLGVTRQAVQKWESGASRPDLGNLTALARQFDVSLDWLISGREPARPEPELRTTVIHHYDNWHYEYKSKCTLFGLPLVHIHLGRGLYRAKGIVAIGTIAAGLVSLGGISCGLLSLGALSLGGIALGAAALGLTAWGGIAAGLLAVGGIALGALAVGGVAWGLFSVGGVAGAAKIAVGAAAFAPLAIGDAPSGLTALPTDGSVSLAELRTAIDQAAQGAPQWLRDFLTFMAAHIHSTPLT